MSCDESFIAESENKGSCLPTHTHIHTHTHTHTHAQNPAVGWIVCLRQQDL